MRIHFLLGAAVLGLGITTSGIAADAYPARPIKMIVPYPPGGGADVLSRTLGDVMSKNSGQPLVVENRAGANGMIGTSACKNAPADGYTFCMVISDAMTINPHIYSKVPYDVDKDLAPVASIATVVGVFAVNSTVAATNLKELAAYSRANRGKVNFGTWGVGSAAHLVMAEMNHSMGADLVHVPYQGVPQIVSALLAKEVDSTILFYGPMAQHFQAGKLRPIGVLSEKRLPQLPDVPTAQEQGFGLASTLWYGVFAPAKTPPEAIKQFNEMLNSALNDASVLRTLDSQGLLPLADTPDGFSKRLAQGRKAWGDVARSLKLTLD
jgi:tripartite-type tricarboxylate transporter receptor subunit TctC